MVLVGLVWQIGLVGLGLGFSRIMVIFRDRFGIGFPDVE